MAIQIFSINNELSKSICKGLEGDKMFLDCETVLWNGEN